VTRLFNWAIFQFEHRFGISWNKVGVVGGLLFLIGIRSHLRRHNLFDTGSVEASGNHTASTPAHRIQPDWRDGLSRSADGSWNDLRSPSMGKACTRFGHNIPLDQLNHEPQPASQQPDPRLVSNRLLQRGAFQPATIINLLAAGWLQFMVHDWFGHRRGETRFKIELASDDAWPHPPMEIRDTSPDGDQPKLDIPCFQNDATHWWDASQLYGSDRETQLRLRESRGGRMRMVDGLLPRYEKPSGMQSDDTGVRANWWLGLGLMHTLFVLEHNAICDHLLTRYPKLDDEQTFRFARLINAALIAKIHTIEWTPALLPNAVTHRGMHGNWWGILGEKFYRRFGRLPQKFPFREVLSGIVGSKTDHHGAPYAITEEFVSIYRMHALIPDSVQLYKLPGAVGTGAKKEIDISELMFKHTGDIIKSTGADLAELLFTFGRNHPGALTLHNYGHVIRALDLSKATSHSGTPTTPDLVDLGTIDVLRDRERGMPLYNDFRELIHKPRLSTIGELTASESARSAIKALYDNDIDKVDLLVGLMAEQPPKGFAFSDTAFRVFVLMASRRLKSDRFFTDDYRPEVYTQAGKEWIDNNTMSSVLLRHVPNLRPYLTGIDNPFKPWNPAPVHTPPQRTRIPWLLDMVTITDPVLMQWLETMPEIDRVPTGSGPLINRILQSRIARRFRTDRGISLPAFAGRQDAARDQAQRALEQRLTRQGRTKESEAAFRALVDHVRGTTALNPEHLGAAVQELIGRLFIPDYAASPQTFRDALLLAKWPKRLWWLPNLERARKRLWQAANNDPQCIHGTVLAVHTLISAIENLSQVLAVTGVKKANPAQADAVAARCLLAPVTLGRFTNRELVLPHFARPLPAGTIIQYKLRNMQAGSCDTALALASNQWNRCPAHDLVPKLLAELWREAAK